MRTAPAGGAPRTLACAPAVAHGPQRRTGRVAAARWVAVVAVLAVLGGCSAGARGGDAARQGGEARPTPSAAAGGSASGAATPPDGPTPSAAPVRPVPAPAPAPVPVPSPPGGAVNLVAEGPDGDVLSAEELPGAAGVRAWRVLYRSRSLAGEPIGVSGLIVRPPGPAPEGGFPVIAWGHGTTGAADACAPSRGDGLAVPELGALLAAGFVVAATDYEGLGTPGPHPYLVGESAGRSLLDAARAAARLPGGDAGPRVLAFGSSQGGHAALFAGQIATRHAPELELLGVAAASPAADVATLIGTASENALSFGYTLLTLATWTAVYPDAVLTEVVTPAAAAELPILETQCLGGLLGAFAGRPIADLLVADPRDVPAWADLLEKNSAGREPLGAPVLVVHGSADRVVPLALSEALVDDLCAQGTPAALARYGGAGHGDAVVTAAADDLLAWFAERLAGAAAATDCPA